MSDLLKLDVKVDGNPIYINGDFGIYPVVITGKIGMDKESDQVEPVCEYSTITGNFDRRLYSQEQFIMYGERVVHPKFGSQYKVQFVKQKFDTPERVKAFLLQFVAPSIADQLLEKYSSDVIQRICDNDVDYSDIKGMGDARFASLREKVMENEFMKDIIMAFSDFGITPNQMKKVVAKFGANSLKIIQENPYQLCKVSGIGFLKADDIARTMGYDLNSVNRIDEAIKYVVSEKEKNGSCWVDKDELLNETTNLLEVDYELVENRLPETSEIFVDETRVALQVTYNTEKYIAERLMEMLKKSKEATYDVDAFLEKQKNEFGVNLTDEQSGILRSVLKSYVNFFVGYAGCGKSFSLKTLLSLAKELKWSILLLSPTGKASKIMESYTGHQAFTIHRALGIFEGKKHEDKPIYDDLIIVDESSMVDIFVLARLLRAIKNENARILFVGDDFQIPSVSAGLFLHDCIESGAFPVTKLTKVFRQAEGGVLDTATKIRLKERFVDSDFTGKQEFLKDMILHSCQSKYMVDGYQHYYKEALKRFAPEDIVILSPTKKGDLGTGKINKAIQAIVNPPSKGKKEIKFGADVVYRQGDRIINIKNNYRALTEDGYDEVVVNGDMGTIVDIKDNCVVIDYGFAKILTSFQGLDTIAHAYALTIHKSQGSGFPCVIVIIDKSHQWQLNANLDYTAWTRTKEMLYVICQANIINSSMKKNANMQRNTFLLGFLKDYVLTNDK